MSSEGDINLAKAEPAEDATSALQNEVTLARASFTVAPDQEIIRPAADTYYVNNGTQPWRADLNNGNKFVPPADNKTSDPYFNPTPNSPTRAKPFENGGTEFRLPGDPQYVPPQDTTDPRFRQVLPNQSYVPDQYMPQALPFNPGYVAPYQQFNAQYSPEVAPRFISNNGVPAYSGMGFQFTSNFYNVGERPALNFTGTMALAPQISDIPVIKISTAFPNQRSFFGVPIVNSTDAVINNPTAITLPAGDNTLPVNTIPVKTAPIKFEPGVVPVVNEPVADLNGAVTLDQPKPVVINPVVTDQTRIAPSESLTVAPVVKPDGVEVKPVITAADQGITPQPNFTTSGLPVDSTLPATTVLAPIDQKTVDRADQVNNSLQNETYRFATTVPALGIYALAGGLPRTTQTISDFAAKWAPGVKINPNINLSAKFRDPAGSIIGLNAYEGLNKWVFNLGDSNTPDSVVGNITVPAGIMAYRALAPNATYRGLGAMVMAGTVATTYYGDKLVPNAVRDTPLGTHTAWDDVAMIGGMTMANKLAVPTRLTNWALPAAAERFIPQAVAKAVPGALGSGVFKVGVLATGFLAGNLVESGWNYFFPGTKTLSGRAKTAMDADSTARTAESLAAARQSFSNLSDSLWSAAQADYAKVKAESETLNAGQNNWEQRAISDRKMIILGAAIGENYLNNGTRVSNQGNTFLGKGTDIDLNSQALSKLREARDAAFRLIRKYNDNVLPATINGTPVNKAAEVAALEQEIQRINGVMKRVYEPHNYEAALPEMVKAANEKPADFFTNFVKYNGDLAQKAEQSLRSQGLWDRPDSTEERRSIAKLNRDKAFALMVLAQRALDVNAGREAVELINGKRNSSDPTTNVKSALIAAKNQFANLADLNPGDIENMNRLTAIYIRLNAQIKAKFPTEYAASST
ncbi:MAG: hypothetical protein SFY67_15535 [Candidatus Melainabacteria bacterium]|nr:hypothetical protein [Candidatus Melainabacteria bacterium]